MKLKEQLLIQALKQEYTGIRLLDAYIADGLEETRMILPCELEALNEAKNKLKIESKETFKEVA